MSSGPLDNDQEDLSSKFQKLRLNVLDSDFQVQQHFISRIFHVLFKQSILSCDTRRLIMLALVGVTLRYLRLIMRDKSKIFWKENYGRCVNGWQTILR